MIDALYLDDTTGIETDDGMIYVRGWDLCKDATTDRMCLSWHGPLPFGYRSVSTYLPGTSLAALTFPG